MPRRDLTMAELVAVIDGPMHGQWFFLDEWQARIQAAHTMRTHGQPPAACLLYDHPSRGDLIDHPHTVGVVGMAVRCGRDT